MYDKKYFDINLWTNIVISKAISRPKNKFVCHVIQPYHKIYHFLSCLYNPRWFLVGYYCSIIAYIRFLSKYRTCISFQNRKSAFIWVNHWAYAYKTMTTWLSWNNTIKYFKAWHFTTHLKTHFWKCLIKFLDMPYIDYSLLR